MHVTLVIMSGLWYSKDPHIIRTKTLLADILKEPEELENNVEAGSTEFLKPNIVIAHLRVSIGLNWSYFDIDNNMHKYY